MKFPTGALPLLAVAALALSYYFYGGHGLLLVFSALSFSVLLRIHRVTQVLRQAATMPKGYVDSAVMFHSKLKTGMPLLKIVAMTQSLGQAMSPLNVQPEVFRWSDPGNASVECIFRDGKLTEFHMVREAPPVSL